MNTEVIAGELVGYRSMADGSLRVVVELGEGQAVQFHKLFPKTHCLVAVARLNDETQHGTLEQEGSSQTGADA